MRIDMTITGMSSLKRKLRAMAVDSPKAFSAAMRKEAESVQREAKEICPYDYNRTADAQDSSTMHLRESIRVERTGRMENTSFLILADKPYALIVHENPNSMRFQGGKQDHYLSIPVMMAAKGMVGRVGKHIKAALKL